jgi:hypothetical protein
VALGINICTTAKLLPGGWLKKNRKTAARRISDTFGEARALFEVETGAENAFALSVGDPGMAWSGQANDH